MDAIDDETKQRLELFFRVAPIVAEYPIGTAMDILLMILADIGVQVGGSKEEFLAVVHEELTDLHAQITEKNDGNSTHH
jgi:hypothetical protein